MINIVKFFSLKLAIIIYQVGPEVINAFNLLTGNLKLGVNSAFRDDNSLEVDIEQLWAHENELRNNNRSLTYPEYYKIIEKYGFHKPSSAKIKLIEESTFIFEPFKERFPAWWNIYNGLKHNKYDHLSKATLFETLNSLSALFWALDYNMDELHINNSIKSKLFSRRD